MEPHKRELLLEKINRFVVEGSEDEFYIQDRAYCNGGMRLRDGFLQSTICGVTDEELPKYLEAVDRFQCNPYDAMNRAFDEAKGINE